MSTMPVAGPSTMPLDAPTARRDEKAAGGRNLPPRFAKEPMYPPGLGNFAPKVPNVRPPATQSMPSGFNNHSDFRATPFPRNYTPKPSKYFISQEICRNYQRGKCLWGSMCYRRHVKYVRDYNPPPVKSPPPIRMDPETPPGLPKKPIKVAADLECGSKVCTSPSEATIEIVSSTGQDDPDQVQVKIGPDPLSSPRSDVVIDSSAFPSSLPNPLHAEEETSASQSKEADAGESSDEEIAVRGTSQRQPSDSDSSSDTLEDSSTDEECPPGICQNWCRDICWEGSYCKLLHVDHSHKPKHPRPKSNEVCWLWERDWCIKGYDCPFIHKDLKYGPPEESVKYPRPRYPYTCRYWLRGNCYHGPNCNFVHDDVEYEDPAPTPPTPTPPTPTPPTPTPPAPTPPKSTQKECPVPPPRYPQAHWLLAVHDHIKVRYAAGFEVQTISTGFETPWLFLEHLPENVTLEDVAELLKSYGQPDIRMPPRVAPTTVVKARFPNHEEARDAYNALNGTQHFGTTIIARLSVNNSALSGAGIFRDSVVRVQWDAPSMVGYGGYSTLEKAQAAIAAAQKPYRDLIVTATLHEELPAVGNFTVRFRNLPPGTTKKDMKPFFGDLDDLLWERLKYDSVPVAIAGIKNILSFHFNVLDFDVPPPPYVDGLVRAWLRFASPVEAQQAANHLHLRRPICMGGKTPLFAHHVQSVSYTTSIEKYATVRSDIFGMRYSIRSRMSRGASLIVSMHGSQSQWVTIKLSSDNLKELSQMKGEFEKILKGEVVMFDDQIAWDPYFSYSVGIEFVQNLQRLTPGVEIIRDVVRYCLILRGASEKRAVVRRELIFKIKELRAREVRVVPVPSELSSYFVDGGLEKLKQELGDENVTLNLWDCALTVRGGPRSLDAVRVAIKQAQDRRRYGRRANIDECPICFDEVAAPFTLSCGHSVCRSCLKNYLVAAIDNRFFPLTCLGNEATCPERIPLSVARELLSASQFDSVLHSAFSAHVHARPGEFHYCPTPDCPQIYRTAPKGTVLQCPSCLIRICSTCHVEQHDGSDCPDADKTEASFKEWAKKHDVKNCPGCKAPIERAEGCNHVTCTRCQTHICWVCSKTFPRGQGIYEHMRERHGGIGLGADADDLWL